MIKLKDILKESPTAKATIATPKTWVDNFWNASGNLLNVVYWLSSLQLKAPQQIKKDAKLKGIINNLTKNDYVVDQAQAIVDVYKEMSSSQYKRAVTNYRKKR